MPMLSLAASDTDDTAILVCADPNGLAYVPGDGLYVADAHTGAILRSAHGRPGRIATIASGGVAAAHRIAGLAASRDGELFVARLGYGRVGGVFRVGRDGAVTALPGLDPRYWRVGVCYAAGEHALYATGFLKSLKGPFSGEVVRIDLTSGETTTVVAGLLKPVGVARIGDVILVSDAQRRAVRVARSGAPATVLASDVDRPDALCACSEDSALLASYDEVARTGSVRRVWLDGRTELVARGDWEPRGVAFDGTRVYVAARRLGRVFVFPCCP